MNTEQGAPPRGDATITALDSFAMIEREWRELGARSDNVFATWEWLTTWWKHFGRGRPLHLHACRRNDGSLLAILPLYLSARRPVRILRFLGHGPSDQLGPVCTPADRWAAATALGRLLDECSVWDLVIADELPSDVNWRDITGGRLLGRQASPIARRHAMTWDQWSAGRSPNWRHELAKKGRRLARLGSVRYRYTTDPDRLDSDVASFLALHDARWGGKRGSRAFVGREAFHREFVELALAQGWLRLWFLEVDGRAVAALYNLRYGGAEYAYQAGRVRELDAYSVGFLLHAHAMHEAFDAGLDEYRFLRGTETYKLRFADHDPGLETIALTRGPAARAVLATVAHMAGYPLAARRMVPAPVAWGTGGTPFWGPP